jgi:hypothetical protein
MSIPRNAGFAALLFLLSTGAPAAGQDDAKKSAVQAKCAEKDGLRPFRLDGYSLDGDNVKVTGLLLRGGVKKQEDEDVALGKDLTAVFQDVLGKDKLTLNLDGVKRVEPKDLPHVALQAAAAAVKKDRLLLEPVRFDKDGKPVLKVLAGSAEEKDWVLEAAKKPIQNLMLVPNVTVVEWKLTPAMLQKKLAAMGGNAGRILVERVRFNWDGAGEAIQHQVVIEGIHLSTALGDFDFEKPLKELWPELPWNAEAKLLVKASGVADVSRNVTEELLVKVLRKAISAHPELDGVRVDDKMSFDGDGRLVLAGIIPNADETFARSLGSVVAQASVDAGEVPGREALAFARTTKGGVNASKMRIVRTQKLLSDLRSWACENVDDVLLARLYFKSDDKGEAPLSLVGRSADAGVKAKLTDEFSRVSVAEFDGDVATPKTFNVDLAPIPSLTTHLRALVRADQKTWSGVLIERGCFGEKGKYTVRGVTDTPGQIDELTKVLDEERNNARWEGYSLKEPGCSLDFKPLPMKAMFDRLKRIAPGYDSFDRLELTKVVQSPEGGLVLSADSFGPADGEWAGRTAKWLLDAHPDWKRRSKGGLKMEIAPRADPSAESAGLSPRLAAEALAKGKLPEARQYLDSAIRHHPDSSAIWYLSALYHSRIGDAELVRRDLFRVIQHEKELIPSYGSFHDLARDRRFELAEKVGPGAGRSSVESFEPWLRREMRDGRKQVSLVEEKIPLPK